MSEKSFNEKFDKKFYEMIKRHERESILSFLKKVREECIERRCEGVLCKSEARYWKKDELNAYVKRVMEGR